MKRTIVRGVLPAAFLLAGWACLDRSPSADRGTVRASSPGARLSALSTAPPGALAAGVDGRALSLPPLRAPETTEHPTAARWRWLKGTTWYVPASNLLAYLFLATENRLVPVSDQTVYRIPDYRDGYSTGDTVVALGNAPPQCLTLVGSVTPEGQVLLTFTPRNASADATVTQGAGQMRRRRGEWAMENQMSSGANAQAQVVHWAYMLRTKPGDRSWGSLPGAGMSVPEFLAQCGG